VFLALGCGAQTFGNYGVGNFYAPFLARVHEMPVGEIGTWLGLTTGFGGMIGTFLGGYLADKLSRRNIRWYMWLPTYASLITLVPSAVAFFAASTSAALTGYFFTALFTAIYLAPSIAVTHNLIDAHKRALASAILFLVLNLIGLGLGPLGIGFISDLLTPTYGALSLRYAFCSTFLTCLIAAALFYMASRHYPKELPGD
ncbi:MAG: MFS transporter, partial [Bacteroidota bacterium]